MISQREMLGAVGVTGLLHLAACAASSAMSPTARNELAPSGTLRAGINYGNVILAVKDEKTGELRGVHVDLAQALGRTIGVPVQLIAYAAAAPLVDGLKKDELDVAWLSAEPERAGEINFSPAYVDIDATYLLPPNSPFRDASELDRDGVRIAIAARSVYEFYLNRTLKHAKLVNAPSTHAAFEFENFLTGSVDLKQNVVSGIFLLDRIREIADTNIIHANDLAAFLFDQLSDCFVQLFDLFGIRLRIDDVHYFVCSFCHFLLPLVAVNSE